MQDELRLRARMITAGVCLSVVLLVATSAWIAATWDRPHRGGLLAIVIAAAVATAIIAAVPHERIVAGRLREPFFIAWSLSLIAFIGVAAALDDGVRSPIVLMLFLTLVYAALSYPRGTVALVSVASLITVLVLSQLNHGGMGPTDPVYLAGLMLTLAVTGVMCVWQARIQQEHRTELGRLSRCDHLTGCLNRLGFAERVLKELRRVEGGSGTEVSLVVLDFDGFKAVNDELGHSAGDDLLCWATEAMQGALRPGDALGRLGGDEFAALLPDTDSAQARAVTDRLRLALSLRIQASAGSATAPGDGIDADALHRCADERLYADKRGRAAAVVRA
jgi:diguanylate cyclase (GGDEF)-like protein